MIENIFVFRKSLSKRIEVILGISGFLLFFFIWHIIATSGVIRPEFLPTPISVLKAFVRLFTERDFSNDILISIGRVWLAFSLSVVIAYPELFMVSRTIMNNSGHALPVFFLILLTYLSLSLIISIVMNIFNRRVTRIGA